MKALLPMMRKPFAVPGACWLLFRFLEERAPQSRGGKLETGLPGPSPPWQMGCLGARGRPRTPELGAFPRSLLQELEGVASGFLDGSLGPSVSSPFRVRAPFLRKPRITGSREIEMRSLL